MESSEVPESCPWPEVCLVHRFPDPARKLMVRKQLHKMVDASFTPDEMMEIWRVTENGAK